MTKKTKKSAYLQKNSWPREFEFLPPSGDALPAGPFFPPAIFTDVIYTNGVRVDAPLIMEGHKIRASLPSHSYASHGRLPVLTPTDSAIWKQNIAAQSATTDQFPVNVGRHLGTITRTITDRGDTGGPSCVPYLIAEAGHQLRKWKKQPTNASAKKEALLERGLGTFKEAEIDNRVNEILEEWKRISTEPRKSATWDALGNLPPKSVNDSFYVPLSSLLSWIKAEGDNLTDSHAGVVRQICHERMCIPVDCVSVLEACLNLADPSHLWHIPLIFVYPVVMQVNASSKPQTPASRPSKRSKPTCTTWRLKLGIYAHRLLPEATTTVLKTVMAALDEGSYRCTQGLSLPTHPNEPSFDPSPYPVVCVDDDDLQKTYSASSKTESSTFIDSTREESCISAYTTKGLLKLLENRGCDISNWDEIAPTLGALQLDLMLHQQHAICWMHEMEHLPGFGINSIFWEEREFGDGGKYYYAPALGQLRLHPPPTMKGGLLCDEMGLGKTIEIIGLVLSTLDELKSETQNALDMDKTHATLIVVPPVLVEQWRNEIVKCAGPSLLVDVMEIQNSEVYWRGDVHNPDIVLVSYNVMQKMTSVKHLAKRWGRIVLDEMQEVRSSTTKIARMCEKLKSDRRWMISGTPLFEGIEDLKGELNFLHLEPFSANSEDGFFNFAVTNPWESHQKQVIATLGVLGMIMLRRSKSMTIHKTHQPILGLKPLTVEFIPVVQSLSERTLYCFLECITAREFRSTERTEIESIATKEGRSRCLYLTLLRDICNSAVLLNGGMGVPSQLGKLNAMLIGQHRRATSKPLWDKSLNQGVTNLVMTCDEAIVHLAQVQEATRAGDGEVAFLQLGFGQGLVRRVRAFESVEAQLDATRSALDTAIRSNAAAKRQKAKVLWHLALEKVTTGFLQDADVVHIRTRVKKLWKRRYSVISQASNVKQSISHTSDSPFSDTARPPYDEEPYEHAMFLRGWRLSNICLVDYFWAHPNSFRIEGIPPELSIDDVAHTLAVNFRSGDGSPAAMRDYCLAEHITDLYAQDSYRFCILRVPSSSTTSTWTAGLAFKSQKDAMLLSGQTKKVHGIQIASKHIPPLMKRNIDASIADLEEARALQARHPTLENRKKLTLAKNEFEKAKRGLCICSKGQYKMHAGTDCENLVWSSARVAYRFDDLESEKLISSLSAVRRDCSATIGETDLKIYEYRNRMQKLRSIAERKYSENVQAMSSFDALQALAKGRFNDTQCIVCLGHLGSGGLCGDDAPCRLCNSDAKSADIRGAITMTKCGHLYCVKCFEQWSRTQSTVACIVCRKKIDKNSDFVTIDPTDRESPSFIADRRSEARLIIKKASDMISESNGELDPELWEQLYHSIEIPQNVDSSRHCKVSVLPGDFMGHLRSCTGLPVLCHPSQTPVTLSAQSQCLSSKIKALLRDLPSEERSVVFSSSAKTLHHLEVVFKGIGIGYQSLFSGQATSTAERAVSEWHATKANAIPCPVLLVQAGAAASGLTLTKASKMFIMEPFVRHEEEQQAYARCHRYGQTNTVHCKCYYTPVSVESRLLEWRKRAVNAGVEALPLQEGEAPQIVYAPLLDLEDEAEIETSEVSQMNFLLGLGTEQIR